MGVWVLNPMGHDSTKFTSGGDEDGASGCQSVSTHSARIRRTVLHDGVLREQWGVVLSLVVVIIIWSLSLVAYRVCTTEESKLVMESAGNFLRVSRPIL